MHPDTILFNGHIHTLNERHPHATALATFNDRFAFVGDDATTLLLAGARTKTLDLRGRSVVPGFCDAHIHLVWFGMNLLTQADLTGAKNIDDVLSRLGELASKTEGWIRGHGFDQSKLAERRFPTRAELDRVSSDRPIVISRVCGHAGVINSAAMALLTDDHRLAGDSGSGLFTEQSLWRIYQQIPLPDEAQMEAAILAAGDLLLDSGITSVQTLLDVPEQMQGFTRLHRAGRLPVRVVAMPPWDATAELHRCGIRTGFGDSWLRVGACKLFSDGSLGARTAYLFEPYTDAPGERGTRFYEPEELRRRVQLAQERGFSVAIHAIGDAALNDCLDAIEAALDNEPDRRGNDYHRHRIEHASLCTPAAIERLAQRRIAVTLQPQFVVSDSWTPDRIGPARVPWAYPFQSMLQRGVPVALSSDCPVERPNAFDCLAAAVGRADWSTSETLTPQQAIEAYCTGSAWAGAVEAQQGSIEPGKLADFVVLSGDPMTMSFAAIHKLRAEQVWLGGKRVR